MKKEGDFAIIGVTCHELVLMPRNQHTPPLFRQGSPHPDLSEAEQRVCIA